MVIRRVQRLAAEAGRTAKVGWIYVAAWANRRLHPGVRVVGITGSAGKTTTAVLCDAVLSEFGPCHSNLRTGNLRIPVAKLVRGFRRHHLYSALEMSGNKPDYLDLQMKIARPNIGVITVVGRDHYSAFKSIEAIAQEKRKMVTMLPAHGIAVLNADDPRVREIGESCARRVIWVGAWELADVRLLEARSVWPEPLILSVAHGNVVYQVRTRLHGTHLAPSVLATLGVAVALELPLDRVVAALEKVEPEEGRMQIVEMADGVTFIRDDWKAPHWSLPAPIAFLRDAQASRKIVIVGTVSDSPRSPSRRYPSIAREVRKAADLAIFVGPDAAKALKARSSSTDQSIQSFVRLRDANEYLKTELRSGDLVLLKGINQREHLVRLMLDRNEPVVCWAERCRLQRFCGQCSRLFDPVAAQATNGVGASVAHIWYENDATAVSSGLRVIVGLGNPGDAYRDTPHNAGHHVLEWLAKAGGGRWEVEPEGQSCVVELDGARFVLFKPGTLMNISGPPVLGFLKRVGGHPEKLIVAHDEMDFDLGDVRMKHGGGDAGHKGVRSVTAALGTESYRRLRIGVRKPTDERKARQAVLEKLSRAEMIRLNQACEEAEGLIRQDSSVRL